MYIRSDTPVKVPQSVLDTLWRQISEDRDRTYGTAMIEELLDGIDALQLENKQIKDTLANAQYRLRIISDVVDDKSR